MIRFLAILFLTMPAFAGDNHVHIEQVSSGDNVNIDIDEIGYGNLIRFSTAHNNNTFNLTQKNDNNTVSWVPWWGSGASWGGDVDGVSNVINIDQRGGAVYGAHVLGDYNAVDVYQDGDGDHETYLDIHSNNTNTDIWQEGAGDKYARLYYYGTANNSDVDLMQKGSGAHTALITLKGSQATNLDLLQQGVTDQSYSLTQTCVTAGGCTINVTQGD